MQFWTSEAGEPMSASGSLATLGVAELLQIAALFRKMGSLRLTFAGGRVITVYFEDGNLSGLTDTGGVWQLGELLRCLGRLPGEDKDRLLEETRAHGKRLGQLLVEEGFLSRVEMEALLRKLIMQSLLFALENENRGEFHLDLGAVFSTSVMFPITDFLIEITSSEDELGRLAGVLGAGGPTLRVSAGEAANGPDATVSYRQAQVMAHVEGEKTPLQVAAASPFSPTETLHILAELAQAGLIEWVPGCEAGQEAAGWAPVLPLRSITGSAGGRRAGGRRLLE
jgi:hypothetical protein